MGFREDIKNQLKDSVGGICSSPACRMQTVHYSREENRSKHIGEAAHICASNPSGPRYNIFQTEEQRQSFDNGIWLCPSCHTAIDKIHWMYPIEVLVEWKQQAEHYFNSGLNNRRRKYSDETDYEDTRRANAFLDNQAKAIQELSDTFFYRSGFSAVGTIPDSIVYLIWELCRTNPRDTRNKYWNANAEFMDRICEMKRMAEALVRHTTYFNPLSNKAFSLKHTTNEKGETEFESDIAAALWEFLQQHHRFRNILSNY